MSSVKWFDGIGEYKINWRPRYRIYFVQNGKELIVLFGGGIKKSQQSNIEQAFVIVSGVQKACIKKLAKSKKKKLRKK